MTGKQTAEGDVKFKVTVTQAAPVDAEAGESAEDSTDTVEEQTSPTDEESVEDSTNTAEEQTSPIDPEETADQPQSGADAETDDAEADTEEKSDTDIEDTEDTDTAD